MRDNLRAIMTVLTVIIVVIFFSFINSKRISIQREEKAEARKQAQMHEEAESQISAWENMFENIIPNYSSKDIRKHKYEYMQQAIQDSELEESEDTSSVESDLSGEIDSSDDS